jgi:predicted aminopeptidase
LISNNSKRQEAYDRLRKLLNGRICRALSLADEDLASLSLSQLINLVFLMHGDTGSTGNFNVSFATAIELVGVELVWQQPEIEKIPVAQFVQ